MNIFVSKVKIFVKAGDGGKGVISFRREKFVPFGGPDGGDGGKGGDIIFIGNKNLNTLSFFRSHRHFFAKNGTNGAGSNCHGKNGVDSILEVPLGTSLIHNDKIIYIIHQHQIPIVVFPGGKGGIGNGGMATSTDRAPRITLPATSREMQELQLILTLKTDVGLLGKPNAGKSSLINCLSRASSLVGDYEFTTNNPILGQMYNSKISLMDLPGIIADAYLGKGKGIEFLRHSEQCKIFIHVIDITNKPIEAEKIILEELQKYGRCLINTPIITILNKIDLLPKDQIIKIQKKFKNSILTSTVTKEGIDLLEQRIKEFFPQMKEEENIWEFDTNPKIFISYDEDSDEIIWGPYYHFFHTIGTVLLTQMKETRNLSILLTNSASMIELNNIHQGKKQDTNILSLELVGNEDSLGEIILSYHKIETEYHQTKIFYESFEEYLIYLLIHGFLHLLGFDHEKEEDYQLMLKKEKMLMDFLKEKKMIY
jgi:GTPase